MFSGIGSAAIGAVGSLIGGGINAHNAREQMAMQREFAQNGIRWKVADAKAAGIHPLAALGAQTFSYNPVMAGDHGVSEALARMGQGVDRAAHAKALAEERLLDNELKRAQIDNVKAQTDAVMQQAIASKAALAKSAQVPPMPPVNDSGTGQPSPYWDKPINELGWVLNEKGQKIGVVPSESMKSRTEDVLGFEWLPFIKAGITDLLGRFFGKPVNKHYWHGLDRGYLPYPPRGHKHYTGGGGGA